MGCRVAEAGPVRAEMRGGVRLLWLTAPPGNLFGPALCTGVMAALRDGFDDAATQAIVLASALRGPGQGFSGGIDLADLGRAWPATAATPADILRLMQGADVPVIAALHGPVLGAGAEIALAARARIAAPDLRFGLRDMLVGRLPMAGATQTLPRLIGAAEALRLIGKGVSVGAAEAVAMGIVDAVAEGDLVAAAVALVGQLPAAARAPGLRDGRSFQAAIVQARSAGDPDVAQVALIDCIEAAQLLPVEQGLDFEAEAAAAIAARPEAAALQHLMVADMRMVGDLAGGQPALKIGLWGAETWPLILPALRAGLAVVLADDDRAALLGAVERVALAHEEQVATGRLTPAVRDLEWARLRPAVVADDLAGCALIFAAKPGATGLGAAKQGAAKPGTAGPVVHFGAGGGDGARLLLVAPGFGELQVPDAQRGPGRVAAATLRLMRLRLAITQHAPATGVAHTVVMAAHQACRALHRQGVAADQIRRALAPVMRLPIPLAAAVDPATAPLVMPADTIRTRVLGAIAAAGARLLEQGAVPRAGTLDVLAVIALGMARTTGGPLFCADQRGLIILRRDLVQWQQDDAVWTPPALLDGLISQGKGLSAFDQGSAA